MNKIDEKVDPPKEMPTILPKVEQKVVSTNQKDVSPMNKPFEKLNNHKTVDKNCQICPYKTKVTAKLWQHYYPHFTDEIQSKYAYLVPGNSCSICKKKMRNKNSAFRHVGIDHIRINEILVSKDLFPIPVQMIVSDTTNALEEVQEECIKIVQKEKSPKKDETRVKCQICKSFINPGKGNKVLWTHYIHAHFYNQIMRKYKDNIAEKFCNMCKYVFKNDRSDITHIGRDHKKLNDYLEELGYKTLQNPERAYKFDKMIVEPNNNHIVEKSKPPEENVLIKMDKDTFLTADNIEKSFPCNLCNERFFSSDEVSKHTLNGDCSYFETNPEMKNTCHVCNITFKFSSVLDVHKEFCN